MVVPCQIIASNCEQDYKTSSYKYRMVGNFREGFIFALFASQELFAKIKTAKFLLFTCEASEPCFNPAYFKLYIRPNCNRSLSASVPSTAIAQTIQEIKVLRQHRPSAQTERRHKVESGSNRFYKRPGFEATGTKS